MTSTAPPIYCDELLIDIAEKERRYKKAEVDGKSADSRNRFRMHSAVVERNIHCTYLKGEDAHYRGHCICEKRGAYYGNYAEYCLSHFILSCFETELLVVAEVYAVAYRVHFGKNKAELLADENLTIVDEICGFRINGFCFNGYLH